MENIMNFSEFINEDKWIADATEKNVGKLHDKLHVSRNKKIPISKINKEISKLYKKKEHTAAETKKLKELQLAKTLKKMNK